MLNVETPFAKDISVQSHPLCLSTKTRSSGENVTSLLEKHQQLNNNLQQCKLASEQKVAKTNFQLFPKNLKRKNCEIEEKHSKVSNTATNARTSLDKSPPATVGSQNKMSPSIERFSPGIGRAIAPISPKIEAGKMHLNNQFRVIKLHKL